MPSDITLNELMVNIEHAKQRMSRKNPHRLLFRQCQDALIQLAQRAGEPYQMREHAPVQADPLGRYAQP